MATAVNSFEIEQILNVFSIFIGSTPFDEPYDLTHLVSFLSVTIAVSPGSFS